MRLRVLAGMIPLACLAARQRDQPANGIYVEDLAKREPKK